MSKILTWRTLVDFVNSQQSAVSVAIPSGKEAKRCVTGNDVALLNDSYDEITISSLLGGKRLITEADIIVEVNEEENSELWVDLGLPSGILWATHNVGATSPEEGGDFFAFGEVVPKESYTLDNYKYKGDGETLTKYLVWHGNIHPEDFYPTELGQGSKADLTFEGDNQYYLDDTDDAATVGWNNEQDCHTPISADFLELIENCNTEIETINGVEMVKYIGPNGNYVYFTKENLVQKGLSYMNRNLEGRPGICGLMTKDVFNAYTNSASAHCSHDDDKRWLGYHVRPVKKKLTKCNYYFHDYDGSVIATEKFIVGTKRYSYHIVDYFGLLNIPDGKGVAGWKNLRSIEYVESDKHIYPNVMDWEWFSISAESTSRITIKRNDKMNQDSFAFCGSYNPKWIIRYRRNQRNVDIKAGETYYIAGDYSVKTTYMQISGTDGRIIADGDYRCLLNGARPDILPIGAFRWLFADCKNLISAPDLPNVSLIPEYGCERMFANCSSLKKAIKLNFDSLGPECFEGMYVHCTALEEVPDFENVTEVPRAAFMNMFSGCVKLEKAPELGLKSYSILHQHSFAGMFFECSSLKYPPSEIDGIEKLTSNGLQGHHYNSCLSMFEDCISLESSPIIKSKWLGCSQMFKGCLSLKNITALFIKTPVFLMSSAYQTLEVSKTNYWVQDVSNSGTFKKLANVSFPYGDSGIPNGWTVEEYVEGA